MSQKFVHVAADGVEVDWIDPYEWHRVWDAAEVPF